MDLRLLIRLHCLLLFRVNVVDGRIPYVNLGRCQADYRYLLLLGHLLRVMGLLALAALELRVLRLSLLFGLLLSGALYLNRSGNLGLVSGVAALFRAAPRQMMVDLDYCQIAFGCFAGRVGLPLEPV